MRVTKELLKSLLNNFSVNSVNFGEITYILAFKFYLKFQVILKYNISSK